jgi:hypothetical protein
MMAQQQLEQQQIMNLHAELPLLDPEAHGP